MAGERGGVESVHRPRLGRLQDQQEEHVGGGGDARQPLHKVLVRNTADHSAIIGESRVDGTGKRRLRGDQSPITLGGLGMLRCRMGVYTNAAAAIGIAQRAGVGRTRRIDVAMVWIQQKIR